MYNTPRRFSDQELLQVLSRSHNAIAIYTTDQIIVQAANDAMLGFWGKDKRIIGMPLEEAVPELKGQPFIGILQNVWRTGITYAARDTEAELLVDGRLQSFYFDFIYEAIRNEAGAIYCILNTADNVTERYLKHKALEKAREQEEVLKKEKAINRELTRANQKFADINKKLEEADEKLKRLNTELEDRVVRRTRALSESESRFRSMIEQSPVAMLVTMGEEMVFDTINQVMLDLIDRKRPDVIGKPYYKAIPELIGQPIVEQLLHTFHTGEAWIGYEQPIMVARQGKPAQGYYNLSYTALVENGQIVGVLQSAVDVTAQVMAVQTIKESEKRSRFLLNDMPQQVWTSSPTGVLDYVNEVLCTDFGSTPDKIVAEGWSEFIHPEDCPDCRQKWKDALKTGIEYVVEFRLRFTDGVYRWHLGKAVPFIEDGQIKLWLGTNTNIDYQKNNEHNKDEFMSVASHELKTPLTAIKGFNQLMRVTTDAQKLDYLIVKSAKSIVRLENLVNDLLDVTKINASKITYNVQPFSFKDMIADSIENIRKASPAHDIILNNTVDMYYPGDRSRLEQVMHNLLANAVKYSPTQAKVIVNCKLEDGDIGVSIQDFGIGIEKSKLHLLFGKYYKVDNRLMGFEGFGLGLYIASEILKRHNADFWIESEKGNGSTFHFRLPMKDKVAVQPKLMEV